MATRRASKGPIVAIEPSERTSEMAEGRGTGVDIARIKLSYSILPPTTFLGSFPRSLPLAGRSWRREQARPRISPASTPRVILLCPLLSLPALPILLYPAPLLSTLRRHVSYASRSRNFVPRFLWIGFSNSRAEMLGFSSRVSSGRRARDTRGCRELRVLLDAEKRPT